MGIFEVMQDSDTECYFAWNFGNLAGWPGTTGATIEWRQPPGVTAAEECLAWTELALEFVQAARGWGDIGNEIASMYKADVDGFKRFIIDRGGYARRDVSGMDSIFRGRSGRVSVVDMDDRIDYPALFEEQKKLNEEQRYEHS